MVDPNDFVDADGIDEITHASFTIMEGDEVDHIVLVYNADGNRGQTKWSLSIYNGYRYNGPDIPISGVYAHDILSNLGDGEDLSTFDWAAYQWTTFE